MRKELVLHSGARSVTRDELDLIPVPVATETYQPVAHYDLVTKLATVSQDLLTGYTLSDEKYGIARQANQLFGVLKFKNADQEMGLSIGFRNSYDKSLSVGIAVGATVFVCDNLALSGSITVMKKHTKNIWDALEEMTVTSLYRARHSFEQIRVDSESMKAVEWTDADAARALGLLYFDGVLSPRQLPVTRDQWLKPDHVEFQARTPWSFYNACTHALKSTPPAGIMERHIALHDMVVDLAKTDYNVETIN